jgi:hypothetical protein
VEGVKHQVFIGKKTLYKTSVFNAFQFAGPEQAIFCGTTTVRLSSSGHVNNEVLVQVRPADENDLSIATLICPI